MELNQKLIKLNTIFYFIIILFLISIIISVYSGLNPMIAIIWNILTSLNISYNLSAKYFETPYILIATGIDMIVFGGLTVLLATWFFSFLKNVNLKRRLMIFKINKLKNHIIIVPFNRDITSLLEDLDKLKKDYVIIADTSKELKNLDKEKRLYVVGKINSKEIFEVAGIMRAKYLIAYSYIDLENILTIVTAKSMNPNLKVIVRVNEEENIPKISKTNANKIIIPDISAGNKIANQITSKIYKIMQEEPENL
ncbi:MAG: NAD-binding protein [Candidatus Marsarchaeota archaeon]|nr:NAD-binding protein [Candidatus Marsarchaeota archaeon]MCL5094643.1 NAD-binding protein [Candidatus Marsarchaeota archaeon]